MVSKLVAVDTGLHLPTAVQNQLKIDLEAQFTDLVDDATNAAAAAAASAVASDASADAADASADAAAASAASAAAPTDAMVASLVEAPSSTQTALDTRYARDSSALARFRAACAGSITQPVYMVFTGDSYIAGQDATRSPYRFVNRLARTLQASSPSGAPYESTVGALSTGYSSPLTVPGIHVLNGGVGATSSYDYLTPTTLGYITTLGPKVVFHIIGTNDLATTPQTPKATYKANILANINTINAVHPSTVHILVHGMLRPDAAGLTAVWTGYNEALNEIAASLPSTVAALDISRPFFASGNPGTDLFKIRTVGGIHPADAGMALMANETARLLEIPANPPITDWFVLDSFNRPNAASLGVDEFSRRTWVNQGAAVYTTASYKAVPTTVGVTMLDTLRSDLEINTTITMGGTLAGVTFRGNDVDNYLFAVLSGSATALYKRVAGVNSILATAAETHTAGVDYQVRVIANFGSILVYVNGILLLNHTLSGPDTTTFAGWTKAGFYTSGTTGAAFDNFGVRPA